MAESAVCGQMFSPITNIPLSNRVVGAFVRVGLDGDDELGGFVGSPVVGNDDGCCCGNGTHDGCTTRSPIINQTPTHITYPLQSPPITHHATYLPELSRPTHFHQVVLLFELSHVHVPHQAVRWGLGCV